MNSSGYELSWKNKLDSKSGVMVDLPNAVATASYGDIVAYVNHFLL